jgi:hypothetical protein
MYGKKKKHLDGLMYINPARWNFTLLCSGTRAFFSATNNGDKKQNRTITIVYLFFDG